MPTATNQRNATNSCSPQQLQHQRKPATMKWLLTLTTLTLMACGSDEPPISISTYDKVNPLFKVPYVKVDIIALIDEIEIQDVIVNRGNCKRERLLVKLPKTIKYGQSVDLTFAAPCTASEVEVITSEGDWVEQYE
jgi:hypothetical protein